MAAVVSLAAAPRLFERVWIRKSLPADPLAIADYLADRSAQGAAAATVRTIRAAIRAGHVDTGADDPTGHDGVRRVLQGINRQTAGRGRGQADPLTADISASPPIDLRRFDTGTGSVVVFTRYPRDQHATASTGHQQAGFPHDLPRMTLDPIVTYNYPYR